MDLETALWQSVTNVPVAVGGRFSVTNSAASSANGFYRLHRP